MGFRLQQFLGGEHSVLKDLLQEEGRKSREPTCVSALSQNGKRVKKQVQRMERIDTSKRKARSPPSER